MTKAKSQLTLVIMCLLILAAFVCYLELRPSLQRQNEDAAAPTAQENPFVYGGLPRAINAGAEYKLLTNRAYITGYSESRKDPIFTAYHLKGLPSVTGDKREKWETDTRTDARVTTEDYVRSGYDRGHMAPNHVIDVYFGHDAQAETFLMTNVVPQMHTMNAGVWEKIELLESDTYGPKYGEMWVMVGPIFDDPPRTLPAGEQIPAACFRIWVRKDGTGSHAEAFIVPNEGLTGKELPAGYISTVKEVEAKTHLAFFEGVGAEERQKLEVQKGMW